MLAELVQYAGSDDAAVVSSPAVPRARYLLGVAVLALLYLGSAQLGYALDFSGPVAAIVWLPVGVGISFLYLGGMRFWPGVLLGDLLANDYTALPIGSALGQTTGNILEMLAATALIRRLVRRGSPLESVRGLGGMLVALAAGTVVSATIGGLSLRLGGVTAPDDVVQVWRTWWLGDFTGALIVVPLAIAWSRPPRPEDWRGRLIEAILVLAIVAVLTDVAFMSDAPITYIVFPALMWAALRFGQRGATLAVAIAAGLTVWDTTHFSGPFAFESITRSVLATQLYIAVAALTALCLAAVVSERELFARRLAASRLRLIEAADTERRRLEHDLHDGAQQRLTALAVRLDQSAEDARDDPGRAARMFEEAGGELALAIEELRQLAHGLHPAVLSHLGLSSAVRDVALRSAVPITITALPTNRVASTVESTAYFVFAEAVTNAQKHAQAHAILVRIVVAGGFLRVEVSDDGVGGAAESAGSGLEGLRDRVEAVGGSFALESPPGRGTRVRAAIPLTAAPLRAAR
jgi:signal transduction histidine kinase